MQRKVPFTLFLLLAILLSLVPGALAQGPVAPPLTPPPQEPPVTAGAPPKLPEPAAPAEAPAPLPLPPGVAAVASGYSFSAESGSYTEITGGTVLSSNCDDQSFDANPIGFVFTFDTITYTQVSIQCNGFVAMGPSVYSTYTPISADWSTNNIVAALAFDLQTRASDADLRYELLGSAPNRVLVIQWRNLREYGGSQTYNFQIRLHETTNVVEVVYGSFVENGDSYPQVGLRGASNTDFHNRTTGVPESWVNSVRGTYNDDSMYLEAGIIPVAGLTYLWTPRVPGPNYETAHKEAPAQIVIGDLVTYTISFSNTGEFTGSGTLLTDTLPAGMTYYTGTLWCSQGNCSYDPSRNSILWTGDIAVSAGVQIGFAVDSAGVPCGRIVNTALIAHPATGNTGRASAGTQTVLTPPAVDEGFDAEAWPPAGWSVYDRDAITSTTWVRDDYEPHSGTGTAYHDYDIPMQDGWLVTPRFTVTAGMQLTFWQRDNYDPGDYYYTHSVQLTTDPSPDPDVSTYVAIWDGDTQAAETWEQTSLDLGAFAGQQVYVAFRYEGDDGDDWYIDDVSIRDSWYPCPAATFGPSRSNLACLGTDMAYPLKVRTNYITETFAMEAAGFSWPTVVLPPSVTVPWAGQATVTATVRVPWNAAAWATDTVTITATGQSSGLSGQATATTQATTGGWDIQWRDEQPQDQAVYFAASYYEQGHVCVVGGATGLYWSTEIVDTHRCFDLSTGTWFSRAPLPTAVFAPAHGLIHGKFYVAGGANHYHWSATDMLQIYDPATDSWDSTTGAPLPSARAGQASGVIDGKLYSAGGGSGSSPSNCPTYEYDPLSNTWATRASCPLQDNEALYLGGSVASTYHHRLFAGGHMYGYPGWFAYDPVADTWQQLADIPIALTYSPLIVEDPTTGLLYQIGGIDGSDWPYVPHNDVRSYDYLSDTWSEDPPDLPIALGGSAGPPQGSFGDPAVQGFWTIGGMNGEVSLTPFLLWQHINCPPIVPNIVPPDALSQAQCADTGTTRTAAICNSGIAPLDWAAGELTGTRVLAPSDIPWLSLEPLTGTVLPDACQTVTVTYDSAGLSQGGSYTGSLVLSSNDPDTPLLSVPVTLTIKTPTIAVFAPPLAAELCSGTTTTLSLNVCSVECLLSWTVGEVAGMPLQRPPRTFTLPALPETAGPDAKAYAPARGPRQVTVAGGPYFPAVYNVLVLSPDSSRGDIALLLNTLAAYPDLAVTVWDNGAGSPTAADLAPYDVVVFGNYTTWESAGLDRVAIGDALADYIEGGGTAIESEFAQSYDAWGLAGRYMAGGYSPFVAATLDYPGITDTMDIVLPDHPVMQGVGSIEDHRYQQNPGLRPGGTLLAAWAGTGNNAVAVNDNVVALNMLLFDTADWSGDVGALLHNAIVWLAYQRIPWLAADPIQGSVAQGTCATVTLALDAGGMAAGSYTAGLFIDSDDPHMLPATLPVTLTVRAAPEASFDYAPDAGYPLLTVHFTDTSQYGISPTWTLGDGGTGAGMTISHTYTTTGDYTVTLTVQSPTGCAAGTAVAVVRVVEPGAPLAGFASSTPNCLGDTTVFTNTTVGTGTITYEWAFGDGGTATETHPMHIYPAAGTYTVILTATNAAAQSDTAVQDVVIGAAPAAGFTYTVSGLQVALVDGSAGATSHLWSFGDGTFSTETNPLHTYARAGIYTVVLTATNDCGVDMFAMEVTTQVTGYTIYLPIVTKSWTR